MTKRYVSLIISLCLLTITITPAFATLPNEALFNWVEYKFADLFPQPQTVKSELTHEGVHYDLRSWTGAWGTRYLGITDDGEIIGLGDYTDGELKSFGYIDDWEDAVIADNDNVFSNLNPTVSFIISETPDYSQWRLTEEQKISCFNMMPVWHFTKGLDDKNHAFFFPTMYYTADHIPGMEFIETSPDKFTLTQHLLPSIEITRAIVAMDTERTDITRFAIANTGAELAEFENPDNWNFGYTWVATDYGNGFEFEKINDVNAFYHGVAATDIDNDGYDELIVNNLGVKDESEYRWDSLHAFDQVADGVFEQYDPFDREHLTYYSEYPTIFNAGTVMTADLNNDGVDEVVQAAHEINNDAMTRWGGVRIWQVIDGQLVEAFVTPIEGLWEPDDDTVPQQGASGLYPIDYNNDGLSDILVAMEQWWGTGLEIYRNDGNLQFTRVTDEVFPDHVFDSDYIGHKEMAVADVNNDGLDDIVLNAVGWSVDINQATPGVAFEGYYPADSVFPGDEDFIPWNEGAAIFLNTGTKFVRQIDNPAYTIQIKLKNYPKYLRFMDTKDGVTRFFGVNYTNNTPVVFKIEAE